MCLRAFRPRRGPACPDGVAVRDDLMQSNIREEYTVPVFGPGPNFSVMESLILAQNERWRHGLGMQVERETRACLGGKWRKGE